MRWVVPFAVALALGAVADAAPHVELRAHSQLVLQHVKRLDDGQIEVIGQLVDRLAGDALRDETVVVTIGDHSTSTITAADGSFRALVAGDDGPVEVRLTFRGTRDIDRAEPLIRTIDPSKSQIELAITKLGDAPTGAKLRVTAGSDDGPVQLSVDLALTPMPAAAGNAPFRPLRSVEANTDIVVTRAEAGGAGMYRLRATFPGDSVREPTQVEATLELTSGTTTTMQLAKTRLAYEDTLAVTGKVIDDDGQPLKRAAVTLSAGDKRLAQGVTEADGSYHYKLEADLLGEGSWGVQVQTDPGSASLRPSRSDPQTIKIAPPQPVPVSYTVAAFVATALAAGGFFLARTKPWQRLRRPAPPAEVATEANEAEPARGGLVVAKPGLVSTLRRPNDDGFSGVVRDSARGRPVAQALVRLALGDADRVLHTAADGAFAIERLTPGDWQAEVAAPGHVTERFVVSIPHRGELRGVRIDLVPVRERVFQLYRRAAEPVLPEPRLWGVWSPRQIVDHVRGKRPSPALAELTDFVEEVYFSARVVAETVLPHASERVDRAIAERTHVAR